MATLFSQAAAQRAREMMARRQKLGGETEAVVEKGPATSKEQLWDEEWKAAQAYTEVVLQFL